MIRPRDWQTISTNERGISVQRRHFFACRCSMNPKAGWNIEELDRPIQNGAKFVVQIAKGVPTKELSAKVVVAVGGTAEAPDV